MKLKRYLKIAVTALIVLSLGIPTIVAAQPTDGPYIVIIGTPAAGKSAMSELLSTTYDIPWVNVRAELLKQVQKEAKKGNNTASMQHKRGAASAKRKQSMKQAITKLEAGELVSGDTLNAFIATEVLSSKASGGFILDGFPMTVEQAEFLDSLMEIREMTPLNVIYLSIPDNVAMQRMKERGNKDDKRDIGKERLKVFRQMIDPLVDYYDTELTEIDASQSKSAVAAEIARALRE